MACWLPRVSCGLTLEPAPRGEVGELRYICAAGARVRARVYGRKAGNFTNFTTRREGAVAKVLRLLVSSANVVSGERNRGIEQ
jgi:hypothetical protein